MKRVILGSLVAAVVIFFWGFLYWNVLPLRNAATLAAPDEQELMRELSALPESGTYQVPDPRNSGTEEEYGSRLGQGPVALVLLRREGGPLFDPMVLLKGFLHMLVTTFLIAIALRMARLPTFGSRFVLVLVLGLAAATFANLGEPIWFYQPWGYHILQAFYDLTVWSLAGLVLAKLVRPE